MVFYLVVEWPVLCLIVVMSNNNNNNNNNNDVTLFSKGSTDCDDSVVYTVALPS